MTPSVAAPDDTNLSDAMPKMGVLRVGQNGGRGMVRC